MQFWFCIFGKNTTEVAVSLRRHVVLICPLIDDVSFHHWIKVESMGFSTVNLYFAPLYFIRILWRDHTEIM